jgi:hypothetical protein
MTQAASSRTWIGFSAADREIPMTMDVAACEAQSAKSNPKKSIEYHLIFSVSFIIFFLAALIERLMPWTWWSRSRLHLRTSIFARAWDAAQTCTAYAFMG